MQYSCVIRDCIILWRFKMCYHWNQYCIRIEKCIKFTCYFIVFGFSWSATRTFSVVFVSFQWSSFVVLISRFVPPQYTTYICVFKTLTTLRYVAYYNILTLKCRLQFSVDIDRVCILCNHSYNSNSFYFRGCFLYSPNNVETFSKVSWGLDFVLLPHLRYKE